MVLPALVSSSLSVTQVVLPVVAPVGVALSPLEAEEEVQKESLLESVEKETVAKPAGCPPQVAWAQAKGSWQSLGRYHSMWSDQCGSRRFHLLSGKWEKVSARNDDFSGIRVDFRPSPRDTACKVGLQK